MRTPINSGLLQSDLDCAGFDLLNFDGGGGTAHGIPAGGTTGQSLTKIDATDYNAQWSTVSGGGGGGGGGTSLYTVNVKDSPYNAAGNGVTDDTVAIQAAIDAVSALGGGRIYFPPGTYLVGGALQDVSGRNAQLLLPNVPDTTAPVTIELLGALAPPTQWSNNTGLPPATAFSTLKSTLTGATGSAAFIAGMAPPTSVFFGNVQLVVRNLIVQMPPNPSFSAFDCRGIMGPQFYNVLIHTGALNSTVSQPTNGNAVGIKLAPSGHAGSQLVWMVDIWGFYTGMWSGELATCHVQMWNCIEGVGIPFTHHPSTFLRLGVYGYQRAIVNMDSLAKYVRILSYAAEHNPSAPLWQQRIYDVDDGSSFLYGDVNWVHVTSNVGVDHSFIKNGGTNLICSELGTDQANTRYIGTDARLVSISSGAKLQVRNTSTGVWADADQWTNP